MRRLPLSSHLVLAVGLAVSGALVPAFLPGAARAAALKLPVWQPGSQVQAPFFRGDVIEVQLAPAAARAVTPRRAGPTRARPIGRLGLPTFDAVAASVGAVAFEPEFAGEQPPADGEGPDFTAFHLMHLAPGSDLSRALDAMRALPEVLSADPIAVLPVSALPNDSLRFVTYWLEKIQPPRTDIRAPEAWQVSQGDTGIVVAIIDTGVIPYHPDLGGRGGAERGHMWANWIEREGLPGVDDDSNGFVDDVAGWDFVATSFSTAPGEDGVNADNDPNDWAGHGTAVAGVVGAIPGNGIGLAGVVPSVRLMALRMGWLQQGATPPSGLVDMSYAAAAIRYATRNGAHVMNCSWQSENTGGLGAAVTAATRAGVILVNAAGNFGTGFTYLGQREDVIAVTATDSNDVVWDGSVLGPWVDLAAAGVMITSTMFQRLAATDSLLGRNPAYRSFINGTSFSSPQVSGAVALMQAHRRSLGLDPLTSMGANLRLRETTDDIQSLNFRTNYGTGRLNLFRALSDPPRSLAVRTLARNVGPPVVLRYNKGRSLVVYAMSDRSLIAFDGVTGDTVWTQTIAGTPVGQIAAVDLGGPNGAMIVVPATNGTVHAVLDNGSLAPGWPVTAQAGLNLNQGAAIGDLDGDGAPDVVVTGNALSGGRIFSWRTNGTPLANISFDATVTSISALALGDVDGLPGDEIALTDDAGMLHVLKIGSLWLPGYPVGPHAGARAPVIARLGSPGTPPSVLVASTGQLSAYAADGLPRWSQALNGTPAQDPVLADLDNNGVDEIVLALGGPSTIDVRDSTGATFTALPGWPAALPGSVAGPLVVGPLTTPHGPCVMWFQATGLTALTNRAQTLPAFPKPGLAGLFPSLADLDGDSATEVAAGAAAADSNVYTYDAGAGTWAAFLEQWPTPRGDYQRSASHGAGTPLPFVLDRIRPARVMDLVAEGAGNTSARVRWTVTGDDSLTGVAQRVVLRRATYPLVDVTFDSGILVPTGPPRLPGEPDTLLVTNLPEGSQWFFALRVVDEAHNASALSTTDSVAIPGQPPVRISDLRVSEVGPSRVALTWTAIADGDPPGRPFAYVVSGSLTSLDSTNVDDADFHVTQPATVDPGGVEGQTVEGLTSGRRYYFAVRAIDESNTKGPVSNIVVAITPIGGALGGKGVLDVAPRPNPAVGSVTVDWFADPGYTGPNHLLIHDTNGRLLHRIALGSEAGGSYTWDGRDGDSRLLPAGLYFLRLVSGSRHADSRAVFLRR